MEGNDPLSEGSPPAALLGPACAALPACTGVSNVRRLTGGANQETWAFDAMTPEGAVPLILRRARGGKLKRNTGIGMNAEARVISVAGRYGVPVPEVLARLRVEDGIGDGFIMRRIPGETVPRKILRDEEYADARTRLARQCGVALAAIHAVPRQEVQLLESFSPIERVEWLHGHFAATSQVSPVFSYTFAWLRENVPPDPERLSLVHGDFRNGNLMVGVDGLRAVLDWENAHVGDPVEDLGWFCIPSWRFGNLGQPAGGFGSREELVSAYVDAGGQRPSEERFRFWAAYGSLYWGMVCARSVNEFRKGADQSIERAMIARRVSEAEIDLLRLLTPRS